MGPDIGTPMTAPGILALSDVLEVSMPASGGTFKAEVDPDVEVDVVWPWPAAWTVTSD